MDMGKKPHSENSEWIQIHSLLGIPEHLVIHANIQSANQVAQA